MRYSDRPISHPANDALDRKSFALALARSIDNLKVAESGFVIGLIGPWGAGKSSVVELILHYLRQLELQRVSGGSHTFEQLDEMALLFGNVEPVIQSFVDSGLDVHQWDRNHSEREFLRLCGTHEGARLAEIYWSLLKKIERHPQNIVVRFSPWLIAGNAELASALLSDIARALGEKLGQDVQEAFAAVLSRLSQVVPLAGAAVDVTTQGAFGGLFSAGVSASDRLARRLTSGPTLDEVRERLRSKLRSLKNCKILLVIDDLDRLTPKEAVEMISLVKGLGDFPNVVYLLCYDEARLSNLISVCLELDGAEYIQKIVQYPVHLPLVDPTGLSRLLDADLKELLPDLAASDQQRLTFVWRSFIRHYMKTPRDVRRLVNAFSVAIAGLGDHTDPIDLLVLEAIRINEPDMYRWVRDNIEALVRQ